MIKAHCMGTEFPKRDTDSPNVKWLTSSCACGKWPHEDFCWMHTFSARLAEGNLPSAADLDAVAEEQRVKDKTS